MITVPEMAIVLSGTIVPNAPFTPYAEPAVRRKEYLDAINFYGRFAPVYFLENSSYCLAEDAAFTERPMLAVRKFPPSKYRERGKGYQEFEMLDAWVASDPAIPSRWMKITGRYLYRNFPALLRDALENGSARMIIDRHKRSRFARSSLFYVETEFYREHLMGIYRACDDRTGVWIEHVLYQRLAGRRNDEVRAFAVEPRLTAIGGSSGVTLESRPHKYWIKSLLRRVNHFADRQFIWYVK
jgi:hypothetical protein